MTSILAVDMGYGYTKAVADTSQRFITPSLVGPSESIRFESDVVKANGSAIEVHVDGRRFFVGEQAELQSASASQTLDATRTGSLEQKALFYAVASELVGTKDNALSIITGLPVADFDERNKALLCAMLEGPHIIERTGKHQRAFTVENVYTLPQAMGSLFTLVLDKKGKLVDGDLAAGRVAILDVGMLTTNLIMVDRLRYVETGSDSITVGMGEALGKIAKDLKRQHSLDWTLQMSRVDRAVRARHVEVYDERVDISDMVDKHLTAIGDVIISKARSLWGAGADLKAVIVTGGGARELTTHVERAYPHTRQMGAGDPQFGNVVGYLRAGLRRFG